MGLLGNGVVKNELLFVNWLLKKQLKPLKTLKRWMNSLRLRKLQNTPGTAGGPGGRDRTLAVKSRKNFGKITFFSLKNKIYPIFFLHKSSIYAKI